MEQLARDVKALEDQLLVCTRCGMCQARCPLYARTRREPDVSRGKIALIQGLIDQMFDDAKGVKAHLERCLLCGSCAHGCPSGVSTLEIFIRARSIITQYLGMPLASRILFKRLLSRPEAFNSLLEKAARFQGIFLRPEDNFQSTSCARLDLPLLRHRHLKTLAGTPLSRQVAGRDLWGPGTMGVKVAFFTGCLVDKAFPGIGLSSLFVLKQFNAKVLVPEGQGCCGIPALAAGDMKTFEELVVLHTRLFSETDTDYLVTACATCSATIIRLWPALIKTLQPGNPELIQRTRDLAGKTVDISWLLNKRFDPDGTVDPHFATHTRVTYHDPCHLKKSLGVFEEPRGLIRSAGHTLVEMDDPDHCCGMGGSFSLSHYDLSAAIGEKKADDIIRTGCDIAATSCPACMIQITDMLARKNSPVRVVHPVELFAERLKAGY